MKVMNPQVTSVFEDYPPKFRSKLASLRKLIIQCAEFLPDVGKLEETLKWGEPSYLPKNKNVGTTVRIHWLKSKPEQYGVYFNCQTTLISNLKKKYPNVFKYEGKRAIIFEENDKVPKKLFSDCISMALTYHLDKKKRK